MTMTMITIHITTIAPIAPAIPGIGSELEDDEEEEESVKSELGISVSIDITVNLITQH